MQKQSAKKLWLGRTAPGQAGNLFGQRIEDRSLPHFLMGMVQNGSEECGTVRKKPFKMKSVSE